MLIWCFFHIVLAQPSISLSCNGATDVNDNIVFDCTSDVDLSTANLQCFLNGTQQATCKSCFKLENTPQFLTLYMISFS